MTVRVSQKIVEGSRSRIQNFEGLVIAVNGSRGVNRTFTVRRIIDNIGVEKVFPLAGKTITKIEVIKQAKVRRAKLYHARELRGKAARMKENYIRKVIHEVVDPKSKKAKKSDEEAPAAEQSEKKVGNEDVRSAKNETKPKPEEAKSDTSKTENSTAAAPKSETPPDAPAAKPEEAKTPSPADEPKKEESATASDVPKESKSE